MACPICESHEVTSLYLVKGADIVECRHCSMIYVPTPAPELLSSPDDYQIYRGEFTSQLIAYTDQLIEAEKLLGAKGRVLDIGCALGHFGEAAKRRNWDVYVADVSEYAVHKARQQFGLNGFVVAPEKLPVKPERFQLVTLNEVIEHISHPLDLLRDVRKALTGRGLVHITTPNANSLSARIMNKKWFNLKPSEHLLYFTPETLRSALERTGFEVIKIRPLKAYRRVHDVLVRMERYFPKIAKLAQVASRLMGLSDKRIQIYNGIMQVWARPVEYLKLKEHEIKSTEQVKDILDIVCCSQCKSDIQLFEDNEAICTQCEHSFEVADGVINFSRYAKHGKRKVVGSS